MKYINIEKLFEAVIESNPDLDTDARSRVWELVVEFGDKLEQVQNV
jgi:hypothetical protein